MKIVYTAGAKESKSDEVKAVKALERLLVKENGFLMPNVFVGKELKNREIDAILVLPDVIFLLDFKNWAGQRVDIDGLNGKIRCLLNGKEKVKDNTLNNYE